MVRFCHVQPNGKRRPIDNGLSAESNVFTSTLDKLRLCGPLQPVFVAEEIFSVAQEMSVVLRALGMPIESGGEDLPDAYRGTPTRPEDLNVTFVAVWDLATDS